MSTVIGVVAFVVALLVSVMIHEWGHLATAKRFGMKATEFFVGFGPRLWSTRRGETEYGVKAVPAGGYVKIIGMSETEPVDLADADRAFYRFPAPQRAVVMAAGSFMHFVIGLVLLFVVFGVIGLAAGTTRIAAVSPCLPATADAACAKGDPASPAARAGLRTGDTITAVNGAAVTEWSDVTGVIRESPGKPVVLTVANGDASRQVTVVPEPVQRPSLDDQNQTVTVGAVGLSPATVMERQGPLQAARTTVSALGQFVGGTFTALWTIPSKIPQLWQQTFGDQPRDPGGLVGVVGVANVSGQIAGGTAPAAAKVSEFLLIIAGLNIFVGLFNLLPLLPLDGGHLAVLGYEQARRGVARLRGRPDPGRVDVVRFMPVAYVVLFALVSLTVLLLFADIINPPKI